MQQPTSADTASVHGPERPRAGQPHDDGTDLSADAALSADGPLEVSDDDRGSDPYNRTGRFRRTVR